MWKFHPILKETIWGGSRIAPFKGLADSGKAIGESWELSGVSGSESVVSEGPEAGMTLSSLLDKFGDAILGERNYKKYGNRFPLLIKFIDARHDLSVQVHPDDETAHRHGLENGKTEMWYVMDGHPGATIANGFSKSIHPADYENLVTSGEIEAVLNYVPVKPGDVFLIPGGRVHAICAGVFVAEIQQTSDATYRIYDYRRKDASGNERELHIELAREALSFEPITGAPIKYHDREDIPVNLIKTPYFSANVLNFSEEVMRDYSELDSFVALVVMEGSGRLHCGADRVSDVPTEMEVKQGDTVLVSASANGLTIIPGDDGLKMLETYVA